MAILCVLALMLAMEKDSLQPKMETVQFCDHFHASSWTQQTVVPGQVFSIRYHLEDIPKPCSELQLVFTMKDGLGSQVLQMPGSLKLLDSSVKRDFWAYANVTVPAIDPGKYQLLISVQSNDHHVKLEASRTLTVVPACLAFYSCSFSLDLEGKIAASPKHLLLLQPSTVHLGISGLKIVDSKVRYAETKQILSLDGKVLKEVKYPPYEEISIPVPGQTTGCSQVHYSTTMPQTGDYLLRFTVEDLNAHVTIIKEISVRCPAPDVP